MIPEIMKSAVLTGFGGPDVVRIANRPVPGLKPDQLLVRTRAASVNSGDARIRARNVPKGFKLIMGLVFGFNTPKIETLGTVFAGDVAAVGANVTAFKTGDRVFGSTEMKMGTHAEYVAIKAKDAVLQVPDDLTYEDAASYVFGTGTAIYFLGKANLQNGERILINGAAGSVGLAMVQMAHARGAHVTAVASESNHEFLRSQGADEVIDYTKTDLRSLPHSYDVIVDCPGKMPYATHRHLLNKGGRFAMVTGTLVETLLAPLAACVRPHKVIGGTSLATKDVLNIILNLHQAGNITPVIDKRFAFEDISQAHAHVDSGHKRGNCILTL